MSADERVYPYENVPTLPEAGPIDVDRLLEGNGDIELEIGFGRGHFLLDRAKAYPQTRFLGIETRRKWVFLTALRARKLGVRNADVRCADIRDVLPRFVPNASIQRVFMHFPDPWWKARHAKRILLTPPLVDQITRLLVPGGELFIQTDVCMRADVYLQVLSRAPGLGPVGENGLAPVNPFGARSLREKHCEEIGLPVYRLHFSRLPQ